MSPRKPRRFTLNEVPPPDRFGHERRLIVLAAFVALALVVTLAAFLILRARQETAGPVHDEVRIGFQTIPNGEVIVKQQGWLEAALAEQGIRVRWIDFASGSDVNAALASGDVDIGLVGSTLFAIGVERGIPYQLIWIHDVIGRSESLVVRSDRGYTQVADLRGKVVATPFGSTTHYTLLKALERGGLSPSDVILVDLKPQDIVAAWTRGDIDAAYVWEPTLSLLEGANGHVVVSSADLIAEGVVTADLGAVRTDFLERRPEVVQLYLEAQARAVALIHSDRAEAARIIGDAFDIAPETVMTQLEGLEFVEACDQLSARWLGGAMVTVIEDTARFLYEQSILTRVPTADEVAARITTNLLPVTGC